MESQKREKVTFAKILAYRRESYLPANRNRVGIVETRVAKFWESFLEKLPCHPSCTPLTLENKEH